MVKLATLNNGPLQKAHAKLNDEEWGNDKRNYLGMSIIGHKCHRFLQFVHYGTFTKKFPRRIERLFNVGHEAEPRLIKALQSLGIHVFDQQKKVIGKTGHVQGHIDGNATWFSDEFQLFSAEPFLVEFKTHNQKSFDELLRTPNLFDTKPIHFSQMISYMGHQKQDKGLYVAENKNTSEIHVRVIDSDQDHFNDLQRKEIEVVTADTLLPRIGNDNRTWFECKMCDAKDVCFGDKQVDKDCRNCQYVDVLDGGKWKCTNHHIDTAKEHLDNFAACPSYEVGEMFKCIN